MVAGLPGETQRLRELFSRGSFITGGAELLKLSGSKNKEFIHSFFSNLFYFASFFSKSRGPFASRPRPIAFCLSPLAPRLLPLALILLLPLALSLMPIYAHSAEVTLTWDANTESDLAGYRIHCGTSSGNYTNSIDVGNETSCTISNLEEDRTYFFAVTAYDLNGNESSLSGEVSIYIPSEIRDSDADGITDDDETFVYGTNPNRADTDGDGINDGEELALWGNTWNADYDHDGLVNLLDPDADGDGFSDRFEQSRGTDPSNHASYPNGGTFGLQLREHKVYAAYTPVYTFNKPTSSTIRCASSGASLGNGYMFVSFPKEEIDGKRLSLRWATSATYYLNPFVARVMDGAYDRTSSSDFPTGAAIPYKGKGPLQTIEFLTGSHPAHTVNVTLDLSAAEYSTVTIIIQMNDPWYGEAGYFDIQHLRILDSSDDILWELDLSQTITMEQTGTTGDYGLFGEW